MFKELFGRNCDRILQKSTVKMNGYGGHTFKNYGTFTVDVLHGVCIAKFYITSFGNNLFSLRLYDICEAVSTQSISSIKTREDLIQAYPAVYDGEIGCIKGYKYYLEL